MTNGKKSAFLIVRIPQSMKEEILKKSSKIGQKTSEYIRGIIEQFLNDKA